MASEEWVFVYQDYVFVCLSLFSFSSHLCGCNERLDYLSLFFFSFFIVLPLFHLLCMIIMSIKVAFACFFILFSNSVFFISLYIWIICTLYVSPFLYRFCISICFFYPFSSFLSDLHFFYISLFVTYQDSEFMCFIFYLFSLIFSFSL